MMEASKRKITCRIDEKLGGLSPIPSDPRRIFRVNDRLRKVNEESYRPKMIGIGPYHHHKYYPNTTIQVMEEYKLRYTKNLLQTRGETSVERYVVAMQELEERARNYYADPVDILNTDEFVEMMLLDGCFIVELLRKCTLAEDPVKPIEPIFLTEHIIFGLMCDLLLFENQLPLFVLVRILDMTTTSPPHANNIICLCQPLLSAFDNTMAEAFWRSLDSLEEITVDGFVHLLALAHYCLCFAFAKKEMKPRENVNSFTKCAVKVELAPRVKRLLGQVCCYCCFPFAKGDVGSSEHTYIKSATELKEAGIEFNKFSGTTWFDIKFRKGRMEIPHFRVQENTESILRNLVAHEQYSRAVDRNYFTDYLILMDCLVNSPKDVEIFRHRGIISNGLGEDEVVSTIFNKLCLEVCRSKEFLYSELFHEVNDHCGRQCNLWMASLRRNYFNSPWAFISFLAALVLLLLTVTQTIFSVLSFTKCT